MFFSATKLPNPLALRAASFMKGGIWLLTRSIIMFSIVKSQFSCSIVLFLLFLPLSAEAQGLLEEPGDGSFQSGIGLIRGWRCEEAQIQVQIDDGPLLTAAYGTTRPDTQSVCGDENNGWGITTNWNRFGDGQHIIRAFANNVQFGASTFTVTTLGEEFLTGVTGQCVLSGFPSGGKQVILQWQQSAQNFVIAGFIPSSGATCAEQGNPTYTCTCHGGCGFCGAGGDDGQVVTNVPCEAALDICIFADGPCANNPPGCDGSRVFVHGWTCVPNS